MNPRRRRLGILHLVGLVALVSIASSCAKPFEQRMRARVSQLELEEWHELVSKDFVLYSRGSTKDLERYAVDLARYIAVVERLVEGQPPRTPAHFIFVNGRAEELFVGPSGAAGYISPKLSGFTSFVAARWDDAQVRGVLLHEFTHYLTLRNTRLSYPFWYEEGFAEFLGTIRARGDTMEVGATAPWRLRVFDHLRRKRISIDLAEIFAAERKVGVRYPRYLYPVAWATVHYLNTSPERQKRLTTMLQAQSVGLPWEEAYARAFDEPIEILEKKVEQHAARLNQGMQAAVLYLPIEVLDVRTDWKVRSVPPYEILRLLGEIAGHRVTVRSSGFSQALAVALLKRSLKLNSTDSRAHADIASALSMLGSFEEANLHLSAFESDPEPSAKAIMYAGFAKQKHADNLAEEESAGEAKHLYESAIQLYRRSLELEPTSPFAFAGLGHCQLATSDFEKARDSLAKAQSLGEWDAELTLDRARTELRLNNNGQFRAFLNEVIRLGTDEEASTASELLKEAYPSE